jgi:cobyrinic acid a,c-diamide synthase
VSPSRLLLAGLRGGSGKTIISLGLARHWKGKGARVKPFKKGPDYIDAGWLGRAAGHAASNLDPFLMSDATLRALFLEASSGFDLCFIEGNRGLFDGKDVDGSCSTAHLARVLSTPVVLVLDCTKMTRTAAPIIQGCLHFEPGLHICGVVFNRTAGERHRSILRSCVETYTDVPVLGALPKLGADPIPERHMGLIGDQELEAESALDGLAQIIGEHLDTDRLLELAGGAMPLEESAVVDWPAPVLPSGEEVVIGVVRDVSLWFYYPENLEALRRAGARIEEVSLLSDRAWPVLHGLYLGGGFPETQAKPLSENVSVRGHVRALADKGLPIYAECGGLMYLCSELSLSKERFPMVGVFDTGTQLCAKPQGHGYTRVRVVGANPFHRQGSEFSGHEFHYSRCERALDESAHCLHMLRGTGMGAKRDGFISKNTLACYTHLHALNTPDWARNFVRAAGRFKEAMASGSSVCPPIIAD